MMRVSLKIPLLLAAEVLRANSYIPLHVCNELQALRSKAYNKAQRPTFTHPASSSSSSSTTALFSSSQQQSQAQKRAPPIFGGDLIYPLKVVLNGLQNTLPCTAVYAVLDSTYKRGEPGADWSSCVYIDGTPDLYTALSAHVAEKGSENVAHVRVVSYNVPNDEKMRGQMREWVGLADGAGAKLVRDKWSQDMPVVADVEEDEPTILTDAQGNDVRNYLYDDDDDDDDDDEWEEEMMAQSLESMNRSNSGSGGDDAANGDSSVISPFSNEEEDEVIKLGKTLEFTAENVDSVLNEVRPYLISDGGNVSVKKVEPTASSNKVYLQLEGACGSCPSSTVTMKMGIERVLAENFANVEVIQVESPVEEGDGLSMEKIQFEVDRLKPAITAMGGQVEVVEVSELGVVSLRYRGPNKIQNGLELAIRDVKGVRHVQFVS
mmetsp:Transcript_629/g.1006  ORF Transcript_629/g.1006 Transcript_629/m.1006 type:complete len:434 (-) Transcript_629:71-1372(-)